MTLLSKRMNVILGALAILLAVLIAVVDQWTMSTSAVPMPWGEFLVRSLGITTAPSLFIIGVVFLIYGTDKRV